jgi:hypothetical protein
MFAVLVPIVRQDTTASLPDVLDSHSTIRAVPAVLSVVGRLVVIVVVVSLPIPLLLAAAGPQIVGIAARSDAVVAQSRQSAPVRLAIE